MFKGPLALTGLPTLAQDPPIACQLRALDEVQRRRQKELLGIVRGKIQKTVELPDGFALQMPTDHATFLEVAEWVSLERRCCGFAEFALELRLDDTAWVKMTGKPGAKEVLAGEMGLSVPISVARSETATKVVTVLRDDDCGSDAITRMKQVASRLGVDISIEEIIVENEEQAKALNWPGSPTVRIKGLDIDPKVRGKASYAMT